MVQHDAQNDGHAPPADTSWHVMTCQLVSAGDDISEEDGRLRQNMSKRYVEKKTFCLEKKNTKNWGTQKRLKLSMVPTSLLGSVEKEGGANKSKEVCLNWFNDWLLVYLYLILGQMVKVSCKESIYYKNNSII